MEWNYFEKVHRNKITSKRDGQITLIFKTSKTYQWGALKQPRIFVFHKYIKKHVKVASIFHPPKLYWRCTIKMTSIICPSKLHQKTTLNWCENSSMLTFRRNFDIGLTCWACWYNRTKFVLVSTHDHWYFNVKFWSCFNIDKLS